MPRRQQPPRLYLRKDEGVWIILDAGKQIRTGCRRDERESAEKSFNEYLSRKLTSDFTAIDNDNITIGDIFLRYSMDRGHQLKSTERTRYAIEALTPFWANLKPNEITIQNTLKYQQLRRVSAGTIRRELGVLNTALNHSSKHYGLACSFRAQLPEKPEPLDRWLTKNEVSLLREHVPSHLDRFIIVSLFTGRRKKAILELRWERSPHNGWIDLENKKIFFKGYADAETTKRRGTITMPEPLYNLAKQWKDDGNDSVIHYMNKPVKDVDSSFDRACKLCGLNDVVRHTLKHTAITWAFQNGMTLEDAVDYFATSAETLLKVYRHHSPHHQDRAVGVMNGIGDDIIAANVAEHQHPEFHTS